MQLLKSRLRQGLLILGLVSGIAVAAEPAIEITPMLGYSAGGKFKDANDNTTDLKGKTAAALAFNWRASEPGTQYELFYGRQATNTKGTSPVDMKVEYLQIGGTTLVGEADMRVLPFAVGGIGATRFTPGAGLDDKIRWSLSLGGGVRVPLTQHVRLRFEARGHLTWMGNHEDLFCAGGCQLNAKGKTFFQYEALGGVSVSF